ncbi:MULTISPECIES: hypothetical protein [unclassified Janthinobacterium]|uniref:hypothetical protein n=1 Tax=unclassified Janthinobacterium TaxID=2610881 RepID=UPI00160C30B2|nr:MULTISPECIES: hypothetical protein [unclassified Janthinobacterium]MBB5606029.1 hypothetical protein [Janthinobacterium sp. S3T4]MBB5611053.1 hypothetical protein [Janthinobacterium sp. S3M3]
MLKSFAARGVSGCMAMAGAQLLSGCVSNTVPVIASTSSYECRSTPVDGLPKAGDGAYGCHFQLRDTETKQILPHTPYSLDVYAPVETKGAEKLPLVTLKGITDAHGRSGYVRAPFPIVPERVRFVRMVGTGAYGRSPHLIRPTDGAGVAGMNYQISGCGWDKHGITDDQGFTPLFLSETSCTFKTIFYMKRERAGGTK